MKIMFIILTLFIFAGCSEKKFFGKLGQNKRSLFNQDANIEVFDKKTDGKELDSFIETLLKEVEGVSKEEDYAKKVLEIVKRATRELSPMVTYAALTKPKRRALDLELEMNPVSDTSKKSEIKNLELVSFHQNSTIRYGGIIYFSDNKNAVQLSYTSTSNAIERYMVLTSQGEDNGNKTTVIYVPQLDTSNSSALLIIKRYQGEKIVSIIPVVQFKLKGKNDEQSSLQIQSVVGRFYHSHLFVDIYSGSAFALFYYTNKTFYSQSTSLENMFTSEMSLLMNDSVSDVRGKWIRNGSTAAIKILIENITGSLNTHFESSLGLF